MTPHREKMVRIMVWVKQVHGDDWHYVIGRDGLIKGRRRVGRGKREHRILGTVEQALAADLNAAAE